MREEQETILVEIRPWRENDDHGEPRGDDAGRASVGRYLPVQLARESRRRQRKDDVQGKRAMCYGADGKGNESMKTPDFTSTEVQKEERSRSERRHRKRKGQDARLQDHDAGSGEMVVFIRSLKK
jgi:hypothetical protein